MRADCRSLTREIDQLLAVVARAEHPLWSSSLVVTFSEIGLKPEHASAMRGFSSVYLDDYAAWLRRDPTLTGRPTFALDVDWFARRLDGTASKSAAVLNELRDVALHELAHAVRRQRPEEPIQPETYPDWLRTTLDAAADVRRVGDHGATWWRLYVTLVARVDAIAPRLVCHESLADASSFYGYGGRRMANAWLAAATTAANYLDAPLVEVAATPCPAFDAIVSTLRPLGSEPTSSARLSASHDRRLCDGKSS